MQTVYLIAKTLHILGFVTAMGVSLSTFVAYQQFWKLYDSNQEQGMAAFSTFKLLQGVGMIGLMVVLLAGVAMLAITDWAFIHLLWFQTKLALIGLIFTNGFTLGRISTLQLQAFLTEPASHKNHHEVKKLQGRLNTFQLLQLSIYVFIILLSVFRITQK